MNFNSNHNKTYKINCRDLFQYLISQNYTYITNLFPNISLSILKYEVPDFSLIPFEAINNLYICSKNLFMTNLYIQHMRVLSVMDSMDHIEMEYREYKDELKYDTKKPFYYLGKIPREDLDYNNSITMYIDKLKKFFIKTNTMLVNKFNPTNDITTSYDIEYFDNHYMIIKLTNINF